MTIEISNRASRLSGYLRNGCTTCHGRWLGGATYAIAQGPLQLGLKNIKKNIFEILIFFKKKNTNFFMNKKISNLFFAQGPCKVWVGPATCSRGCFFIKRYSLEENWGWFELGWIGKKTAQLRVLDLGVIDFFFFLVFCVGLDIYNLCLSGIDWAEGNEGLFVRGKEGFV